MFPAFSLYVQYGETFSLLDWFTQFCAVFNRPQEAKDEPADPKQAAKPLVKQRKRGSRKVLVVSALPTLMACTAQRLCVCQCV